MELAKAKIAADATDPTTASEWYGTDEGKFFTKLLTTAMSTNNNNIEASLLEIEQTYPDLVKKAREVGATGS